MNMERSDISKLMKVVLHADKKAPVAYSYKGEDFNYYEVSEALRGTFHSLAPDWRTYRQNWNTIYSLIEEAVDEYLPMNVMERYGDFAEIKVFKQGEKPIFVQKISSASKQRAKQFIGKVGLAGLYEVFKLDGQSYEVTTNAIGGAAQIGFEDYLDGRVDFADVLEVVMNGLDECIYVEIEKQLVGAFSNIQAANKYVGNAFVEKQMDDLLSKADAYGGRSVIYCTFEFAATMIPSDARMSDNMKDNLWENGYLGSYKHHQVIVLPQSYEDETNSKKVIDPSYAWIFPVGAEKPVKIAFEGDTIVDEYTNMDRSKEVQVYKKVGVRAVFSNNMFAYRNTSLTR